MSRRPPVADPSDGGRGGGAGGGGGAVTQLEFTQAMTDFRVMFPDMEADVIEAVLRANHGAVDATIDNLLAMSADNETEKAIHPGAAAEKGVAGAAADGPPSYQQATQEGDLINLGQPSAASGQGEDTTFDLLSDIGASGGGGGGPAGAEEVPSKNQPTSASPKLSYSHPRRPENAADSGGDADASLIPTQQMLQNKYEENLKAREQARTNPVAAGSKEAQLLEDERLALMMQNDEFMAELRSDREFLSALAAEEYGEAGYDTSAVDGAAGGAAGGMAAAGGAAGRLQQYSSRGKALVMDDAVFKEKLRNMGKTSKRKFTQLAGMFSRRKGAKQLLGHAPAPSNDDLLLNVNAEPLVNQDDSDEEKEEEDRRQAASKSKTPTKGKYMSLS